MSRLPVSPARRSSGFTLIELLVVIALIALLMTGVGMAFNAVTRAKLRSGSMRVAAAAHFAYGRAITRGRTVRLAFDLDSATMAIEEAEGRVTLIRPDEDDDESGEAVDPWAAARARLEGTFEAMEARSPFNSISNAEGEPIRRYQAQEIGDGIRLARIVTPHDADPVEEGSAYVYFFPGGTGEDATIQLVDGSDRIFTVVVEGMTGRARVHPYAYEPEPVPDEGAVRDPG
jgi:general secretion pathway protein H